MFYLTKLCRICVQNKEKLIHIDTVDHDLVPFSEKLKICTKMVINTKKTVSKEICTSCVKKLRISYEFYNMCMKSSSILQSYVSKLLGESTESDEEPFRNMDLYVTLSKSSKGSRKKRIGKSERCAAIQKLLSVPTNGQYPSKNSNTLQILTTRHDNPRGGLRDLLSFTKSYDFGTVGYEELYELSPLDKLIEFSESFFFGTFDSYNKSILHIIENEESTEPEPSEDSDAEDMFKPCEEEVQDDGFFEEVLIPKDEIKREDDEPNEEYADPATYVQVCYNAAVKIEPTPSLSNELEERPDFFQEERNEFDEGHDEFEKRHNEFQERQFEERRNEFQEKQIQERQNEFIETPNDFIESPKDFQGRPVLAATPTLVRNNYIFNSVLQKQVEHQTSVGLSLLSKLTRSAIPAAVFKRRTRVPNQTYINPKLQRQFLTCNFKCNACNRRFKSHGYLKAHNSKVHNFMN